MGQQCVEIKSVALLVDLLGNVFVELLPTDALLPETRHVVYHLLDVLVSQVVLQLLRNSLQVLELQHFLLLTVHQRKHRPPPCLAERVAYLLRDQSQEGLKVDPLSGQVLVNCADALKDEFELLVEAESSGSVEDVGDVAVSPVVTVKVEHFEEVLTVFLGEDGVFGDDFPSEDDLLVLLSQLLPAVVHHLTILQYH